MDKIANDRGIASEKLMEFCTFQIHEDYQEEMRKFFDLSTLGERLKEKNFVSREYPNKQGIWRRALFIAQEKVPAESVTEVLYVTQIIDDYKQKELAYQQELVKILLIMGRKSGLIGGGGLGRGKRRGGRGGPRQNSFGKCPMISGLRSMASWVCWILKRKTGMIQKD